MIAIMTAIVIDLAVERRARRHGETQWVGQAMHAIVGIEELLVAGERAAVVRLCRQAIDALEAGRLQSDGPHPELDDLAAHVSRLRHAAGIG